MRRRRWTVLALITLSVAACGQVTGGKAAQRSVAADGVRTAPPIVVSSPAFPDGGTIPEAYSCLPAGGPPRVEWSGVPPEAVEVALVMQDATANGKLHWVVAGIDPDEAGWPAAPETAGIVVKDYFGPCPRVRSEYRIRVFALPEPSGLAPGDPERTAAVLVEAAAIASGQVTGYYP